MNDTLGIEASVAGAARRRHEDSELLRWSLARRARRLPASSRAAAAKAWLARLAALLSRRSLTAVAGALLALAGLGQSGWIHAKAGLAQWLLRGAHARALETGAPVKPWPWADTHPVARLTQARLGVDQIVLASAAGRALAFGPALSLAGARPGEPGNVVISGHRDTHFAFLAALAAGDLLWLEDADGRHAYRVESLEVVDSRRARIALADDTARLTLVTCWPFDALAPRGPLRYVVSARLLASDARAD